MEGKSASQIGRSGESEKEPNPEFVEKRYLEMLSQLKEERYKAYRKYLDLDYEYLQLFEQYIDWRKENEN